MAHTVPETQISQSQVVLPIPARLAAIDLVVLSQTEGNRVTASTQPARGGREHPAWQICPGPANLPCSSLCSSLGCRGTGCLPTAGWRGAEGPRAEGRVPGGGSPDRIEGLSLHCSRTGDSGAEGPGAQGWAWAWGGGVSPPCSMGSLRVEPERQQPPEARRLIARQLDGAPREAPSLGLAATPSWQAGAGCREGREGLLCSP